jgi:DNA-binding transcriptional ArsR family regulator
VFENSPLADLAIGRSTVRQRILALLICEEPGRLHLREIQRRVGTSPGTASRELARLVAAGVIDRESEGIQVYFRASASPVGTMMRQLFLLQEKAPLRPAPPVNLERRRRARATRTGPLDDLIGAPLPAPGVELAQPLAGAPAAGQPSDPDPAIERLIDSGVVATLSEPRVFGVLGTDRDREAATAAPAPQSDVDESSRPGVEGARDVSSPTPPDALGLLVGARFAADIRPLYGGRLKAIYLFGARASGPASEDADVELIVVLDSVDGYGEELERTSATAASLSLELGLVVSRVFAAEATWSPGPGFVAVMSSGPEAAA